MRRRTRWIISIAIIIALVLVFGASLVLEITEKIHLDANQEKLKEQARPYELQIHKLETELLDRQKAAEEEERVGRVMIADRVNTVKDLDSAGNIVVIDFKAKDDLIAALAEADKEVVLSCEKFPVSKIRSINERVPLAAVIIDSSYKNKSNLNKLADMGIKSYFLFIENGKFGVVKKSECVEMTYSAIKSNNYSVGDRVRQLEAKKGANLFVFWPDLNRDKVQENKDIIKNEIEAGNLTKSTIGESNAAAWNIRKSNEKRTEDFEEFRATQQAKLDELQAKVDEIYSHYFD